MQKRNYFWGILLIPVGILTVVSFTSMLSMIFGNIIYWLNRFAVVPILLVIAGLVVIF